MSIEQRLTEALREEADARDVDLTRLWLETRQRLDERPSVRNWRTPLMAAAALAAVAAGALGVAQLSQSPDSGPAGQRHGVAVQDSVDDQFTCPEQRSYDWTQRGSREDDSYVPTLRGGALEQARRHDASRYEFERSGDQAFLRFGNADGTLGLATEFRRADGRWEPFRTETCTGEAGNIAVPTRREWSLETHGGEPYAASTVAPTGPRSALLVDDRSYYDGVGLVRHRSMYAHLCGKDMCISSRGHTRGVGTSLLPGAVPRDVSSLFLPPDEPTVSTSPYGLWALYDVEGEVSGVTAYLRHGTPVSARWFYRDPWPGQLYVLLAPFDEVVKITVHPRSHSSNPDARAQTFTPQDLPGYDATAHR